ncbi:MAG: TMEM175 family protein [Rhodoglobus sp.]
MHTERGFTRLVGFSDGVVAIAITLLVLPLVTSAAEAGTDLGLFLRENGYQLFVFVLSFAVIGRFWLVHHEMYENAIGYSGMLLWSNLLWLLSIVFLPFPTELLATTSDRDDTITYGLYVGTMLLTSIATVLQQWALIRRPDLQAEPVRGSLRLRSYVVTLVIMAIALVISVLVPHYGLYSLLLLVLATPAERLFDKMRKGAK